MRQWLQTVMPLLSAPRLQAGILGIFQRFQYLSKAQIIVIATQFRGGMYPAWHGMMIGVAMGQCGFTMNKLVLTLLP